MNKTPPKARIRPCKASECGKPRYGSSSLCRTHHWEKVRAKKEEAKARKLSRRLGSKKYRAKRKKTLKVKLWELCKKIVRLKYGNSCITCPAKDLEGSNWHTAHFIPSSTCGLSLRYDLRNLRPSCYSCNINLGGNGAVYYRTLVQREGQEYVDQLFRDREKITKESNEWYEEKIAEYEKILSELTKTP